MYTSHTSGSTKKRTPSHAILITRAIYIPGDRNETINGITTLVIFFSIVKGYTLSETNSSHLKIGRAPKGNDRIPTIHFQVRSHGIIFSYATDTVKVLYKSDCQLHQL